MPRDHLNPPQRPQQQSPNDRQPQSDQTLQHQEGDSSEFIRMGDAADAAAASPNANANANANANVNANGNGNVRPSPSSSSSAPLTNAPSTSTPTEILSSFFRKATTTLETSLQAAQQNSSEALTTAQQHVTAASSTAISTVTGLVLDIGSTFNNPRDPHATGAHPQKTHALKSLRLPPPATPLLLFHSPLPTLVSPSALHIFTADSPRPTAIPLNIVQTTFSPTSPAPPHCPITATHAALMPGPRLAIAHDDGAIVVFSLSANNIAAFEAATPPHPAPTTALAGLSPTGLAVARRDGSVHVLNARLQPVASLPPPDMCAMALTPALSSAAAIALSPVQGDSSNLLVAYDDGAVTAFKDGAAVGMPFVAHAGAPAAVSSLFNGALFVTVGNDTDRSIAVFDSASGRCLARRGLPYEPTYVAAILQGRTVDGAGSRVCPSACSFLVGGGEAQVEAFRVVALSPRKVDIKLVLQIGDRQRGRKRGVIQAVFKVDTGVVTSVCENGDIRRWGLCKSDAANLCLLNEERGVPALFTEQNIVEKMTSEEEEPEDARLNCANGVLRAQSILAAILDDGSVPEEKKDELVTTFQQRQAHMLSTLTDTEKDVRRARRRIFGRYAAGIRASPTAGSELETWLANETRRAAAFEAEYATRRYKDKIEKIEQETVNKLKEILKDFLKALGRSDSLIIEQAHRDVDMLGTEEAEVEVD